MTVGIYDHCVTDNGGSADGRDKRGGLRPVADAYVPSDPDGIAFASDTEVSYIDIVIARVQVVASSVAQSDITVAGCVDLE